MKHPKPRSVRLGRRRRWGFYTVAAGVWLTGGLWLLFHYFFVQQGEFGVQTHPLEPWWLKLHGAFAFAAIWIFGLLWGIHITVAWPLPRRRWSGASLTGVFFWLTVSGYLLYYVAGDSARSVISLLHWTVGLACPVALFWHRIRKRKRRPVPSPSTPVVTG